MSSPQLEDGHVRIANELFDAVLRFPFSKRQQTIIWAVMRKTYGYRKKRDDISLSQLSQITGLDASNISKAINELAQMKVLSKQPGRYGQVLEVQKDFQSWRSGHNDQPWSKQPSCSGQNNQAALVVSTNTKRQYSKDNTQHQSARPVGRVKTTSSVHFDEFWSAYPKKTGRKPSLTKWIARDLDSIATKIISNVQARVASGEWNNHQYVPNPLTYINQDRWDVEVTMNKYNADGMAMTMEDAL